MHLRPTISVFSKPGSSIVLSPSSHSTTHFDEMVLSTYGRLHVRTAQTRRPADTDAMRLTPTQAFHLGTTRFHLLQFSGGEDWTVKETNMVIICIYRSHCPKSCEAGCKE